MAQPYEIHITMDATGQGRPTEDPAYVSISKNGSLFWSDPANTWYITFNSPFVDDVIVNDQPHGETKKMKLRKKSQGTYLYTVSPDDPRLKAARRVRNMSAGGIIIQD